MIGAECCMCHKKLTTNFYVTLTSDGKVCEECLMKSMAAEVEDPAGLDTFTIDGGF